MYMQHVDVCVCVSWLLPSKVTALYEELTKGVIERVERRHVGKADAAAAVPFISEMLEAVFFDAHANRRCGPSGPVVELWHFDAAALLVYAPMVFHDIVRKEWINDTHREVIIK